ncbi:MAG TPA: hypothetical protein VLR90_01640 [Blastocatellia bacterium]|nr:hypothetical protein [Blastocatellia bacterium]
MKNITDTQAETPFQKFKQLTERLLSVPKKEIDQQAKKYERKKQREKDRKK